MRNRNVTMSAAGATTPIYVEDVFSSYVYNGTSAAQSINNGIDLSTYGGLFWSKRRDGISSNVLIDSARGIGNSLYSDSSNGASTAGSDITSFNTNGLSFGSVFNGETNSNGVSYASWTFRKAKKFFDVVTYTGNGAARSIPHNLGSVPGMIIIKCYTAGGAGVSNWKVYHKGLSTSYGNYLSLNLNGAKVSDSGVWNSSDPTSTVFYVGSSSGQGADVNFNGSLYVAYLFADDAGGFGDSGTDSVIKCGSITGTGAAQEINLGWEPQFFMYKLINSTSDWCILDNVRKKSLSVNDNGGQRVQLAANLSADENTWAAPLSPYLTSTGMGASNWGGGNTWVYVAIRRGLMKIPTDATKVFKPVTRQGTSGTTTTTDAGFPVDAAITGARTTGIYKRIVDRLTVPPKFLSPGTNEAEGTSTDFVSFDTMAGMKLAYNVADINNSSYNYYTYYFRRAYKFFDIIHYDGQNSTLTVNHNLGVTPEMILFKSRGLTYDWLVMHSGLTSQAYYINLNLNSAETAGSPWNGGLSSTQLTLGWNNGANISGSKFVAYMFASCPGVCKVGSYTGTGTTKSIDCGFTNGARFVMIKRRDSTGNWYFWDTARGIVASTEPYSVLQENVVEVSNNDYIDPYSPGFELSSTAPADLNANGGSYIYLAIA